MPTNAFLTRRSFAIGLVGLGGLAANSARAAAADFGIRDLRDIEPKAVRFIATQGTDVGMNVALFGGGPDVWPKIKAAVEQAASQGCPVRAILVGPVNAAPALEVYAKGQLVTQPIDPRAIAQDRIVLLLRNTKRDFFSR